MIIGTGIDIVEIKRIQQIMMRQKKFINRILTENELEIYVGLTDQRKAEFISGRFAVKEAYSKAIGTGIGGQLSFLDIEVIPDSFGKPCLTKPTDYHVHVSISHSKDFAIAQVIIESLSS
jgi:holo-[acyl-carrier protein] synthase